MRIHDSISHSVSLLVGHAVEISAEKLSKLQFLCLSPALVEYDFLTCSSRNSSEALDCIPSSTPISKI